jgi:Tfp pilus assembly protein PilN
MRAVNLLPRDAERVRSQGARIPLLIAAGGIAVVTAAAVMLSVAASGTANERRAELASTEDAISRVSRAGTPAVSRAVLSQERTDRVSALASALSTRIPFDRLFRELSFVLPEDAWLTGITASAPVSATPAGTPPGGTPSAAASSTQGVTIQGATYSHESVARVLARLAVIPSLDDVRLTASARVDPQADSKDGAKTKTKKQKVVVTFSIAAALRTGSSS